MRAKDIKIGEFYRIKPNLNYTWIKPIAILKPKQSPNTNNFIIVKCEHVINKDDICGLIKYYKPVNIIKV